MPNYTQLLACCTTLSGHAMRIMYFFVRVLVPLRRMTGVDAMQKVLAAWAAAPLYPEIPEVLRHLNNANIKVG
jgi:hypothetical protein